MSSRNLRFRFLYDYCLTMTSVLGIQISMYNFLRLVHFLPYFAFLTCIIFTIFKDIQKSTHTHCKVSNFLPSISAVIAGYEPQRFIWRFSFALNSIPRYLIGYLQLQRLLNRHHVALPECYQLIQIINSSLHFLELTFLLLLTYISSNENKWLHQCGFMSFMGCSLLHMFCTVLIDYYWPRTKNVCLNEKEKSIRTKRLKWFLYNMISFLISLYFFFRHNFFCEPFIYSMYCFFEYFVILTNIAYHSIIRDEWDQYAGQIQIFY